MARDTLGSADLRWSLRGLVLSIAVLGCGGGDDPTSIPPVSPPPTPPPPPLLVVGTGRVMNRFTTDIWVHGNHAYTGSVFLGAERGEGNALLAWDISSPAAPRITDSVIVNARRVNDVKVNAAGTVAVMTHESSPDQVNGVTLLSLADPAHPKVITRFTEGLERGVHNVWIEGDVLYVAQNGPVGEGQLHIIDISDPATPTTLARFSDPDGFIHDVLVRDGLAFLSFWNAGLIILDVGNGIAGGSPAAPVEVSRIALGGQTHNAWYWPARGLVFVGEEEFAGDTGPRAPGILHVVDVSDLRSPQEVATFSTPLNRDPPHNFWVDESREVLYVAWYGEGIVVLDVSGTLQGDLGQGNRMLGQVFPFGEGTPPFQAGTRAWAPQLHNGLLWISDLNNGIASLQPMF